jgi:CRP/FNR family transcriptional regulator, anaerobic regulatory protein
MIEELLNSIDISAKVKSEFLSCICEVRLKRNEFYLKENAVSEQLGFVEKGMLKQFYIIDGDERIRWVLIKGDFALSFSSFIKGLPSRENIQAIEATKLFCINKKDWSILYAKYPIIQNLWNSKIEEVFMGIEERIYDFISKPSAERYKSFLYNYPELAKKIPLKYLASILGISPQHLSRIRKVF